MFYRHSIENINGKDVLYLYVDYNYEFASELGKINNKNNIVEKASDYINKMHIDFNGKKVYVIASGIIVASLLFMSNNVLLNSKVNTHSNNNIITTEVYRKPITENITQEEKIVVNEQTDVVKNPEVKTPIVVAPELKTNTLTTPKTETKQTTITETQSTNTQTQTNGINVESKVQESVNNEQMITLHRSNGIIENITITDYLIGVVASEMPASFNVEALKSQAVVARTYVFKRIAENKVINDTTNNQVYKDNNQLKAVWGSSFDTYYNKVKNAVTSTSGEVVLYNGYFIDALYHSTSNGMTEDPINVWGGSFPYLKSVDSHWDLEASSYLKTTSKSIDEVAKKLEISIDANTSINVLEKSISNRINIIQIGEKTFDGVDIYNLLGLRSRDFDMVITDTNVSFTTRGYGHGVGMSQYGANGMAKEGYSYKDILNHYYQNINIVKKET